MVLLFQRYLATKIQFTHAGTKRPPAAVAAAAAAAAVPSAVAVAAVESAIAAAAVNTAAYPFYELRNQPPRGPRLVSAFDLLCPLWGGGASRFRAFPSSEGAYFTVYVSLALFSTLNVL